MPDFARFRVAEPADITGFDAFLASDYSRFVNGVNLRSTAVHLQSWPFSLCGGALQERQLQPAPRLPSIKHSREQTRAMQMSWRHLLTLLCLTAEAASSCAAPLITTESFARLPQIESVALSPDGKWFAAVDNRGEQTTIITHSTNGNEPPVVVFKDDLKAFSVGWVHWVSETRLLFSLRFPSWRGTATTESRVLAIDRDGFHPLALTQFDDSIYGSSQIGDVVIDWLPGDGHHVLMQGPNRHLTASGVYNVDIDTGHRDVVHGGRFAVGRWITDRTHKVRVGVRQLGVKIETLISDANGDNWRVAWPHEVFSPSAVAPIGFGADPDILYVLADHDGRNAIYAVDLRDPALPMNLVLGLADRDVSDALLIDPIRGSAVGVAEEFHIGDTAQNFWDPTIKSLAEAIDAALPDRANVLLQLTADGSHYLVRSSGNGIPPRYLIGDRNTKTLAVLARQYPEIPATGLSIKTVRNITARDGLKLPVFFTVPADVETRSLPTVVLPHGGPFSADALDFDMMTEFLVSRGYAVLQVNYRGSTGIGIAHRNAGLKQFGLAMQDDITDAVEWLVHEGTADRKRICIFGGDYGGYAALMGGVKTPELYRCVISYAANTDLLSWREALMRYVNGAENFDQQIGGTTPADRQRLTDTSPRWQAKRIKAAVLLIHGTYDRIVSYDQSVQMAKALTDAEIPVRFVTLKEGEHYLIRPEARLTFFREVETFLHEQIGGDAEEVKTPPSPPTPLEAQPAGGQRAVSVSE